MKLAREYLHRAVLSLTQHQSYLQTTSQADQHTMQRKLIYGACKYILIPCNIYTVSHEVGIINDC